MAADTFPRLGGYLIAGPHDYWDKDYQAKIARLDVAILATYPGWGKGQKTDMAQTVKAIKALNPKIRGIFLYVILRELPVPDAERMD